MPEAVLLRRILSIIVLSGFASLLFYGISQDLSQNGPPFGTNGALPVRLMIPKIKVNAAVEYVGLTFLGAMGAPKEPANVAWFKEGTVPGEEGSAVIAGHEGWENSIGSAFDDLSSLQEGDRVSVEDSKGITTTFVVRELRIYDPNADASDIFNSSDGKAHLNLITCEGVWDAASQSYSKRLVVFTDKI